MKELAVRHQLMFFLFLIFCDQFATVSSKKFELEFNDNNPFGVKEFQVPIIRPSKYSLKSLDLFEYNNGNPNIPYDLQEKLTDISLIKNHRYNINHKGKNNFAGFNIGRNNQKNRRENSMEEAEVVPSKTYRNQDDIILENINSDLEEREFIKELSTFQNRLDKETHYKSELKDKISQLIKEYEVKAKSQDQRYNNKQSREETKNISSVHETVTNLSKTKIQNLRIKGNVQNYKANSFNSTNNNSLSIEISEYTKSDGTKVKLEIVKKFVPVFYPVPIERRINIPVRIPIKIPQRVLIPQFVPIGVKVPIPVPVKVEVPKFTSKGTNINNKNSDKNHEVDHIPVFHHYTIYDKGNNGVYLNEIDPNSVTEMKDNPKFDLLLQEFMKNNFYKNNKLMNNETFSDKSKDKGIENRSLLSILDAKKYVSNNSFRKSIPVNDAKHEFIKLERNRNSTENARQVNITIQAEGEAKKSLDNNNSTNDNTLKNKIRSLSKIKRDNSINANISMSYDHLQNEKGSNFIDLNKFNTSISKLENNVPKVELRKLKNLTFKESIIHSDKVQNSFSKESKANDSPKFRDRISNYSVDVPVFNSSDKKLLNRFKENRLNDQINSKMWETLKLKDLLNRNKLQEKDFSSKKVNSQLNSVFESK